MKSATRFSLKARLVLSFGLTLLLTAVLGIYAITSISSENSHVNKVATKIVPGTSLEGQAAALFNKYRKDQLHYILSTPAERAGSQGIDGDLAGDITGMAQVLKQYHQQGLVGRCPRRAAGRTVQEGSSISTSSSRARSSSLADAGKLQQAGQVVGAGAADNTFNIMKAASASVARLRDTARERGGILGALDLHDRRAGHGHPAGARAGGRRRQSPSCSTAASSAASEGQRRGRRDRRRRVRPGARGRRQRRALRHGRRVPLDDHLPRRDGRHRVAHRRRRPHERGRAEVRARSARHRLSAHELEPARGARRPVEPRAGRGPPERPQRDARRARAGADQHA